MHRQVRVDGEGNGGTEDVGEQCGRHVGHANKSRLRDARTDVVAREAWDPSTVRRARRNLKPRRSPLTCAHARTRRRSSCLLRLGLFALRQDPADDRLRERSAARSMQSWLRVSWPPAIARSTSWRSSFMSSLRGAKGASHLHPGVGCRTHFRGIVSTYIYRGRMSSMRRPPHMRKSAEVTVTSLKAVWNQMTTWRSLCSLRFALMSMSNT